MPLYQEILKADKELRSGQQIEHSMSGVARVIVILMITLQNLEKLPCQSMTRWNKLKLGILTNHMNGLGDLFSPKRGVVIRTYEGENRCGKMQRHWEI